MVTPKPILWDLIVRLTHWLTATLFFITFFFAEGGSELHQWLGFGFGLLTSLFVRLTWGFIGSPLARFGTLIPTRSALKQYLSSIPHRDISSKGHNPLGALIALFLWVWLATCVITGSLQETDMFWGEEWPHNLNAMAANIVMAAVILHVPGVITMQHLTERTLIKGHVDWQVVTTNERKKESNIKIGTAQRPVTRLNRALIQIGLVQTYQL